VETHKHLWNRLRFHLVLNGGSPPEPG
jgi:hypothetical protein